MMNSTNRCCPLTACVTGNPGVARSISVVSRLFLALIFILAGVGKIMDYAGTQGYMQSMGISSLLLPLAIALELGGGIFCLLGLGRV